VLLGCLTACPHFLAKQNLPLCLRGRFSIAIFRAFPAGEGVHRLGHPWRRDSVPDRVLAAETRYTPHWFVAVSRTR
jgi:hypothetical protein